MGKKKIMTARRRQKRRLLKQAGVMVLLLAAAVMWQSAGETNASGKHSAKASALAQERQTPVTENRVTEKEKNAESFIVTVQTADGTLVKQDLEEYVMGVVAAEMPVGFEPEALKAQAVAARSYVAFYLANHDYIPAGVQAQDWLSVQEQQARWGENYEQYRAKIAQAVTESAGEVLYWQGGVIEAVYHASCGGQRTAAAQDVWGGYVPYLVSVACPHGVDKHSGQEYVLTKKELAAALKLEKVDKVKIRSNDASGRVAEVEVDGHIFQGSEIRQALGLPSAVFTIKESKNEMIITTEGYGHGVGLCQYGADYYARQGWDYRQILAHFYPETEIGQV